jgi:hypothetical protein
LDASRDSDPHRFVTSCVVWRTDNVELELKQTDSNAIRQRSRAAYTRHFSQDSGCTTHLELSQPLEASPGDVIRLSRPSPTDDEMAVWRDAAKERMLDAYAEEDAVYDDL